MEETKYLSVPFLYVSKGLVAREILDRAPDGTYLNLTNCQEREEHAMSSRYGTLIINRDPILSGVNYFFFSQVNTLARLIYQGSTFRYAGLANGFLYRRSGDTQGQYTNIYTGLSGQPFDWVITNCFQSSQPYLFIYDQLKSIKDTGTGTPVLVGIDPPANPNITLPFSPLLTMIDNFASTNTYTTSGFSVAWSFSSVTTLPAPFSTISSGADFVTELYSGTSNPFSPICNGILSNFSVPATISVPITSVVTSNLSSGAYLNLTITTSSPHGLTGNPAISIYGSTNSLVDGFYTAGVTGANTLIVPYVTTSPINATGGTLGGGQSKPQTVALVDQYSVPYTTQTSVWGFYQKYNGTDAFAIGSWAGTVASNSTATVGKTVNLDLNINNQVKDDDLIVVVLNVGTPANISNIRVQFDVNSSGYTSSYYYKDIAPAYYQGNVSNTTTAYTATQNQILADTLGIITGITPNTTASQLSPGNISTGTNTFVAVYMRRGDFLPVGNAGNSGLNWTKVTGWQVVFTTTTGGSSTVALNGIYLQWGYGPSSFGGVGYDYRYTYYNANTGTESNPSPQQNFSQLFGFLNSLSAPIFLRQAASVNCNFSSDPQVTHIRIYRRGGSLSNNWLLLDQIPNVSTVSNVSYKDVISDATLTQASILSLDNDPPVTSSLINPINTTLTSSTSGGSTTPFAGGTFQTILVPNTNTVFTANQIVNIGTPANLEQVLVISGGVGQFTCTLWLQHNSGEPVIAYSTPRTKCSLAALAYGQTWLAGDSMNPGYLYFSKPGYPENFPPQNYLNVSTPSDPINAVINWRGTLYVGTLTTWYIIQGGASPIAQPTGSQHGIIARDGWTQTESAIFYRSADGIREFRGSEGTYMSLPIEWIYRNNPLTPLPLANSLAGNLDVMAYYNNEVYISYIDTNNIRHRLIYHTIYKRWRIDSLPMTAMLWEEDTNTFLGAYRLSGSNFVVVADQQYNMDYDDGAWSNTNQLVVTPIPITITTPYQDLGKPHNPKQYNILETDVNTQNQAMSTTLIFDDGSISLPLASATTSARQKVQLAVNAGSGQQAYRMSLQHTMNVTTAPIFYQENIYAAELAPFRYSFDTYWIGLGNNEHLLCKQGLFDYTSANPTNFSVFADESLVPYYTFTLPSASNRTIVKVRFPALKMRLIRIIGNISSNNIGFQFWKNPVIWIKPCREGGGYESKELTV